MREVRVELGARSYTIHIGPGARARLAPTLAEFAPGRRPVIITDATVRELHLDELRAGLPAAPIVLEIPPGEGSKTLAVAERLYEELAAARVERDDLIVTFGGGVVGDLGGFVAATWLRGLRFVQVPTTLEAAVDASVGGKTAVNHPRGKNLIGVFHQPSAVIVDTDFLATLPERDFVAGLGESVKHAAIRDAVFLRWHEQYADRIRGREPAVVAEFVARNCAIKAGVVSRDERERGLRAILNYGHTIGHALEHLLEYELRHGECVALGMIAANALSSARDLLAHADEERIRRLIERLGLPVRLPRPVAAEEVVRVCRLDKKVRAEAVRFVLLRAPGVVEQVADVSDEEMAAAVAVLQP